MKSIAIIIFFFLLSQPTFAQIPSARLKADVDFYFKKLHERHPNPYYYYTLDEFEDFKNEIYSQLDYPLTHEQFAWVIGKINSRIDAHSNIDVYSLTHWRTSAFSRESLRVFPAVKLVRHKLFLRSNNREISEINGISVDSLIKEIKQYYNWKLPHERNVFQLEECFNVFLHKKFSIQAPFRVKFDKSDKIYLLEGLTVSDYSKEALSNSRKGVTGYSYKVYPSNSIAIFSIPSFDPDQEDVLNEKLSCFFQEVDSLQIRNIFYDLTKNGGGGMNMKTLEVIRHDTVYTRLNMVEHFEMVNRKTKVNHVVANPNKKEIIPNDRELFVLQGICTASGADYFCRIVAKNKLGTLVGQNTGEPTVAFTQCSSYTMPNSKITFTTASSFYDFSDYFKTETLEPDMYWDVNNCREFTEQELMEIINQHKKK